MTEFKCKRCGKCCGIVHFSRTEYKKIQKIAQKKKIAFIKNEDGYFPKKLFNKLTSVNEFTNLEKLLEELNCPFLSFNKEGLAVCEIYEDRPQVCRNFPIKNHSYMKCQNNQ